MSYRTSAILSAVVSVIYGLSALLVPDAFASVFGITFDAVASYEARLLGGAYLGYGIVSYLTKSTADRQTQRAVAAGNAFAWVMSLVVTTLGQLQGLANALGWTTVALTLVFIVLGGLGLRCRGRGWSSNTARIGAPMTDGRSLVATRGAWAPDTVAALARRSRDPKS